MAKNTGNQESHSLIGKKIRKKKTPHLAKKNVLFHEHRVRGHTCVVAVTKFNVIDYEWLPYPPYSSDLGPMNDSCLQWQRASGMKICCNNELLKQKLSLRSSTDLFFGSGQKLKKCQTKCMVGVQKNKTYFLSKTLFYSKSFEVIDSPSYQLSLS